MALASAKPASADLFDWSEGDGLFSVGFNWFNVTTGTMHAGPPGADDIASLCGDCTVTGDGGSVAVLQGLGDSILLMTAPMSADTILPGGMTVTGTATLTAGNINGSVLSVPSGNVVTATIQSTSPRITGAGTLHATGDASDLSGIIEGTSSTLTIDGEAEDLNFAISGGGHLDAKLNLMNTLDMTLGLTDVGSRLRTTNLAIGSGFLDVANGAEVQVSQGIFINDAGGPPSGGFWKDSGTSVSAGSLLALTGSSIAVQSGAHVTTPGLSLAGGTAAASIALDGEGTRIDVGSDGIIVGLIKASTLELGTGADLTTTGAVAVGVEAPSNAEWKITGAGSTAAVPSGDLVVGDEALSVGKVSVASGGTLQLGKNVTLGKDGKGTLAVTAGGQVAVNGSASTVVLGQEPGAVGAITISGTGSSVSTGGRPMLIGDAGAGSVAIGPGGALVTGEVTLAGEPASTGSVSLGADASWTSSGAVFVGIPSFLPGVGTIQVGAGAFTRVATDLGLAAFGQVVLAGGTIAVGSGSFGSPNTLVVSKDGTLLGDGLVQGGTVIVTATGTVAPGNDLGELTIEGDYTQQPGGVLEIEIGPGALAAPAADVLQISGTARLDGKLVVNVLPGLTPTLGQRFTILTAARVLGKFDQVERVFVTYGGTEVAIALAPSFDVAAAARCTKGLSKAGAAFAGARASSLGSCVQGALKCVETMAAGPVRDACLAKAGAACAKQLAKIVTAEGKLRSAVAKACGGALGDATLLAADGLGYDALAAACAEDFATPLSTLASVTECVVREHACAGDAIVAAGWPRARELLALAAVPSSDIAGLSCLPDHGGSGADLGDPAGAGKAVVRCAQKAAKSSQKLVATRQKSLQRCAAATFACASTKADDPSCAAKATTTCDKAFGALAKADAALTAAVAKGCADPPLAFTAVTSAAGANVGALAADCASLGVATLSTLGDYASCLVRRSTCAAEALLRFEAPRSTTLFPSVGRTASSPFCP